MSSGGYCVLEIMDNTKRGPAARALAGLILSGDPAPGNRVRIPTVIPRNRYRWIAPFGRFIGEGPTLGPDEPVVLRTQQPSTKTSVWTFVLRPKTDLARFQRLLAIAGTDVTVIGLRHVKRALRNRDALGSRSVITIRLTGRGLTPERRQALLPFGRFDIPISAAA